jgi:hypothetical protein
MEGHKGAKGIKERKKESERGIYEGKDAPLEFNEE